MNTRGENDAGPLRPEARTAAITTDGSTDRGTVVTGRRDGHIPFVDTCIEHAYGTTTRLSFQVRVF